MERNEIKHSAHSTRRCQYHIVFAPKFRRKVIYGQLKADIGQILRKLCEEKKVEIIEAEAYPNHIEIWIAGALVARHERLFGRKGESLDLQHYLSILAQKGRAIRYARPVQNAVPAEFLNWLEGQNLTVKETVELLGRCADVGYATVMCGKILKSPEPVVEDPVKVLAVDLSAYDTLCRKRVAAS